MVSVYELIVYLLLIVMFMAFAAFSAYFSYDQWVRQPNYLRAFIFRTTGGISTIWMRKLEDTDGQYKICFNKGWGKFIFLEKDIFPWKHYKAAFFSENACMSLNVKPGEIPPPPSRYRAKSVDITDARSQLNLLSNHSLHPKSLRDVLDTKMLSELTQTSLDLKQILIMVICIGIAVGLIALYFKIGKVEAAVHSLHGNFTRFAESMPIRSGMLIPK